MTLFYLIEKEYVGPNHDQYLNAHQVRVQTVPGLTNMTKESRVSGWLGTTNDWSLHAHGVYETREAAEAAARAMFPVLRDVESGDFREEVVAEWFVGIEEWGSDATRAWFYDEAKAWVNVRRTEAEVDAWVQEMLADAREGGGNLEHPVSMDEQALRQLVRDVMESRERSVE